MLYHYIARAHMQEIFQTVGAVMPCITGYSTGDDSTLKYFLLFGHLQKKDTNSTPEIIQRQGRHVERLHPS